MNKTTKLFHLAKLAEASYVEFNLFSNNDDGVISALTAKKFSPTQAEEFVKNWQVAHHQPDTASGFSATLFQRINTDPISGYQENQYVYAIRGTAGTNDLIADVFDIAADGLAIDQIVDMYNHWRWLTTPNGQTYQVAKLVDLADGTPDTVLVDSPNYYKTIEFQSSASVYQSGDVEITGAGISPSNLVDVTGHSLGGHLASAFNRLFGIDATAYYRLK